ncbi:hypothetical protein [Pseudomonas asplenii]|uniref:Uncharacterized protein n=1 Tax=Pseudomonas asplenii TaxID=53407 RepID=A0A1H6NTX3_9PSED|nr:hypothetical protein [Pseudomonas fuscovaginae]SEI16977.1 hypothetical protein SAMN05216581_3277 [Pseudomonas fuscovaginae]
MSPFEKGYKAFLEGVAEDGNPFPKFLQPYSHQFWLAGWRRAKKEA